MNKKDDQEKNRKSIEIFFTEYRELCVSQNLSPGLIESKDRLYKLLKEKKIKDIRRNRSKVY